MAERILIAVITCAKFASRAQAQRDTWVKDLPDGVDIRYFTGGPATKPDEVHLDVPDDYANIPIKCKAAYQWALANGYDRVLKLDDDVYLQPGRLLAAIPPPGEHYTGRVRGAARGLRAPYCSGFAYWLSRKAMELVVQAPVMDMHEDVNTGNVLLVRGIEPVHDSRYNVLKSKNCARTINEGPRQGNDIIAVCELDPDEMQDVHQEWLTKPSGGGLIKKPMGTVFDKVDVVVKTFLRDGLVMRCIKGIEQNMPGARIIVVDDGNAERSKTEFYAGLQQRGHVVKYMPFDSGYGAKMNAAAKFYERPYVLRIADDFEFDAAAAEGVDHLVAVLDSGVHGIASGRVNNNPYEANVLIEGDPGNLTVTLTRANVSKAPITCCDMTVNYSLIRRELLESFTWDERYKIGGDHLDLYLHAASRHELVCYVSGVNVNTLTPNPGDVSREYDNYRGRARLALPWTFERHGWARMINMDGRIDTRESVAEWAAQYNAPKATSREEKNERILRERAERRAMRNAPPKPPTGKYGIRPDYRHRSEVPHFDATKDLLEAWQAEVYDLAARLFHMHDMDSILDMGCGDGIKLLKHFSDVPALTGVEVEPTLSYLRKEYPNYGWVEYGKTEHRYDMVICADVIEHVVDPDALLDEIMRHKPSLVVLSTPDRSLLNADQQGPPRNLHHMREWNFQEFAHYIGKRFTIHSHDIVNKEQATQCIVFSARG